MNGPGSAAVPSAVTGLAAKKEPVMWIRFRRTTFPTLMIAGLVAAAATAAPAWPHRHRPPRRRRLDVTGDQVVVGAIPRPWQVQPAPGHGAEPGRGGRVHHRLHHGPLESRPLRHGRL